MLVWISLRPIFEDLRDYKILPNEVRVDHYYLVNNIIEVFVASRVHYINDLNVCRFSFHSKVRHAEVKGEHFFYVFYISISTTVCILS